jgi:two-component system nitrogen regulation sensor histidine kinase GlnL
VNTIAGAPDARAQLAALIFAVLLLDEDDRIVEANHAAEEMLGRSARKLAEKRFWDVVGIADHRLGDRLSLSDAQVIARGVTIATAIGDRRVNISSSPMHGNPGWRVVTLSDAGQSENDDDDDQREQQIPRRHGDAPCCVKDALKTPLRVSALYSDRQNERHSAEQPPIALARAAPPPATQGRNTL